MSNIISSTSHTSQMIFQVPVSPAKYNFRYLLTSQILFPVPDTPAVTPATQAASATGSDPVQIWPHGGNYLHLRNHQSNSCVKKIWARVRFSRINAKIYTNCEICPKCQNFCNITLLQYSLPRPLDVKTFSVTMKASDILIAIVNCLHRHPQL